MSSRVVIVGGGPCGLWTAVQTKLRNPDLSVTLLERHQEYQRSHPLKLSSSSFKDSAQDHRLQRIISDWSKKKNIRTRNIEEKLKKLALELGISIDYRHVTDPKQLEKEFPDAQVFIGADGSHSGVRKNVFQDEPDVHNLQYIVQLTYEVEGCGRKFSQSKTGFYSTLKLVRGFVYEKVGRTVQEKTPITLQFFVDQKQFEEMSGATFKSPATLLDNALVSKKMQDNIFLWLAAKQQTTGEKRISGSEKIVVTRLGHYQSKRCVKQKNGKPTWVLVGDAAFGVPFFRSLNNGFRQGTELAKAISRARRPEFTKKPLLSPFSSYAVFVKGQATREIAIARIKNFFIQMIQWFIRISGRLPWQIVKWSEHEVFQLRNTPL